MADQDFNIGITVDAGKAIADQERYNATLKRMEEATLAAAAATRELADADALAALKAEALARANAKKNAAAENELSKKNAIAENERYQATLEKMAVSQELDNRAKKQSGTESKELGGLYGKLTTQTEQATEAIVEQTKSTGAAFTSKKQLKDMVRELGQEFPLLGMAGRMALNPIVAATAAVTASFVILKNKFDEAVKAGGGFETPDLSEEVVARYERLATAAEKIGTNLSGIGSVLDKFKSEQDVLDAMATGFGSDPNSTGARAQAAREAGDRATAEAARLRGIAGNIDPKNAAAGDMSAMLPSLQGHRTEMLDKLGLINSVRDGTAGMKGSARYLSLFGLSDPESMAAKYQTEISQTDAQIGGIMAGGKRRGERLGAFEGAAAAESQAAGFYREAAGLGATQASGAGKDLKSASDALARGDLTQMVNNIIRIAEAATRGKEITDQALRDLNNVP